MSIDAVSTLTVSASLQRDEFSLAVDLAINPGEVVGLTGGIGSGKSSVCWLVAGRLRAASGRVIFGQQSWDEPASGAFTADRPVALMSQSYLNDLPEDQTGTEIVVANIVRLNPADDDPEKTARAVLSQLGVGDHVVDRLPWTFSGAEAQRIALAKAVAPRPPVVVLDEPFGALDKQTGAAVRNWLTDWLADYDGVAIVASTRVEHLDGFADRIISVDS